MIRSEANDVFATLRMPKSARSVSVDVDALMVLFANVAPPKSAGPNMVEERSNWPTVLPTVAENTVNPV